MPRPLPPPVVIEDLVARLRAGNYVSVAARAVGLNVDDVVEWLELGASSDPELADYAAFRASVDGARAESEVRNVAIVAATARENWQAATWLLERQHPERWARVGPARVEDEPATFTADSIDELAERREARRAAP